MPLPAIFVVPSALLKEAFKLDPHLLEWSRKDPDFACMSSVPLVSVLKQITGRIKIKGGDVAAHLEACIGLNLLHEGF